MGKYHNIAAGTVLATAAMLGGLEHRELTAYRDLVVKDRVVVTYCDGETGGGVRVGDKFTPKQCDKLTFAEIRQHIAVIDKYVNVDLSQEQIEALILFIHNCGESAFANSTALKRFNSGDIRGGCDALTWFNRVNGKIIKGLINRRDAEHKLCIEGL